MTFNFEELYPKAKKVAAEKHSKQEYGAGQSYTVHLAAVEAVLRRFGYNPDAGSEEERFLAQRLIVAAWLHDTVEDTDMTLADIIKDFGQPVAALVDGVTNEPGANRAERHKKTYPKTRNTPNAIILKLADRIANIEASIRNYNKQKGSSFLGMYAKEWENFKKELRTEGVADAMWEHLEKLMSDPDYAMQTVFGLVQ